MPPGAFAPAAPLPSVDSGVSGDYTGDSVIPLKQADLESGGATGGLSARGYAHPVLTGISFLYEGYTVSHLEPSAKLRPILLASDGQTLAAAADVPNQRVVIDCGWTRYYSEVAAERAGTLRYAENVAAFLAGQFEPPARH